MGVKVLVLDVSHTTIRGTGAVQPGVRELVDFCVENGLKVAYASNNPVFDLALRNSGLQIDSFATRRAVGQNKPSPAYFEYIEKDLGISKDTYIYVGDTDRDAFCAAHAKILFFSALWVNSSTKYGIQIRTPKDLIEFLKKYLIKDEYFEWSLEDYDKNKNRLQVMSIMTGYSKFKGIAVETLKWGGLRHRPFIMNHLISSLYLSGITHDVDILGTYPSHNVGSSINQVMQDDLDILSKELRKKYVDLFVRHNESVDSGKSRSENISVDFKNQIETVHLNKEYRGMLENKRILVLDDFITKGYSSECARNLLYEAGARDVVCVSVGKYGNRYEKISIMSDFDPFKPISSRGLDVKHETVMGSTNEQMAQVLENSYD